MTPKAVFFDMDGVLYNSMPYHAQSWATAFEQIGIKYPHSASYENEGRTSDGTIKLAYRNYLKREASPEEITAVADIKTRLMGNCPTPEILDGMQLLINHLQHEGIKVMVVTGSKQPSLLSRLKNDFNIEPENIVSGHDVKHEKPNPEPYLIALQKAGVEVNEAIVVENAPLGVQSAKSAGIITIAVNTGILSDQILINAGADIVISNTRKLEQRWDAITDLILA